MDYHTESMNQWAWVVGADRPDEAWLCHDWDVWLPNPHYRGPEVPHPEAY